MLTKPLYINFPGGTHALVAAHLAQLILNWHDDAFVLRQRTNCLAYSTDTNQPQGHKAPHVLPGYAFLRWGRLLGALVVICATLKFAPCDNIRSHLCVHDGHCACISHATHGFGALSGLFTGCLFLKVRHFKKRIKYFRTILLCIFGLILGIVISYCIIERLDQR